MVDRLAAQDTEYRPNTLSLTSHSQHDTALRGTRSDVVQRLRRLFEGEHALVDNRTDTTRREQLNNGGPVLLTRRTASNAGELPNERRGGHQREHSPHAAEHAMS